MSEEITVGIGGCVINHVYSGYRERVYYAGMPSSQAFSLIYETARVRDDPTSQSIVSHDSANFIVQVEERRQLFFPLDTREMIEFASRRSIKFEVKEVTPKTLTAIVHE